MRRTTDQAKDYFLHHGCILKDEYTHCLTPMYYICKCGREAKTSWNNFTKGKRCGYCHETGRKKKWTIEELKNLYSSNGCEFLEINYENSKTPLKFKCGCGNVHAKLLNEFKKFPYCVTCGLRKNAQSRQLSQNEVANYFNKSNCSLLSEYKGESVPLKYICCCGREATTIWVNFKQGKRCGRCGSKRAVKFTLEEVRQLFSKYDCEFLDDHYVNNTTPHNFKCSCGEIETIKIQYFQQGVRCSKCKKEKRSGENHFAWRHDREALKLDIKFRKRVYGFLDRCRRKFNTPKEGHADEVLGYTPKELQEHITNHPNWVNVKDYNWHLDHYFPLEAFIQYGVTDFMIINALENLRPILQSENNQKKDNYDKEEFEKWLESKSYTLL